jgi:ribosomal protein S12 methylthiotransferase accessory factor
MNNIDEKFKDASPEQTVARILEILAENGLHASERWTESGVSDCFSVHVTIDGTECGACGKGITRPLARASGYAELMERLQNGFL